MKNTFIALSVLFFFVSPLFSQNKLTISGYVRDAATGEDLIGASVWEAKSKVGILTNAYGYYALEIPISNDTIILKASFVGYAEYTQKIFFTKSLTLNILLQTDQAQEQIEAIEVVGEDKFKDAVEKTQMSVEKLDYKVLWKAI